MIYILGNKWIKGGHFCAEKNAKPLQATHSPLNYYITLNLNISTSRQNIKNLIGNFGGIHVRIMQAEFQASSFNGVGGEWCDRQKEWRTTTLATIHNGIFNSSLALLGRDKYIKIDK